MPLHDWSRVDAGIFHHFHTVWIGHISTALNEGLLPKGYYALAEQHAGRIIGDVLALHASPAPDQSLPSSLPPATGGVALADAPPRTRFKQTVEPAEVSRRRSLAIRHVSGHRLVALVEIVSPANKDRAARVEEFVSKAVSTIDAGIHLLLVDLFPPGASDPNGLHGAILQQLRGSDEAYAVPEDEPLTLASYVAGPQIDIYVEPAAAGASLPDMPLFLRPDRYINVPLESTYQAAYHGVPAFWRDVLERRER